MSNKEIVPNSCANDWSKHSINFIITTQQDLHNEWMAFACWYSIHRNMPESKVGVIFPRAFKHYQFTWLNKCHVPYLAYSSDITSPEIPAANTLIDSNLISKPIVIIRDHQMIIKEGIQTTSDISFCENSEFVTSYMNCDRFDLKEWIKTENHHPFYSTKKFMSSNRTANELKVFQLWKQMGITFDFLNK